VTPSAAQARSRAVSPGPGAPSASFACAPAPIVVRGRRVVPLHIRHLSASVVLDCRTRTAFVEAVVEYELWHGGRPFFDLRQEIGSAWLDGHALDVSRLASGDVGEGPYAEVRVIDVEQAPGSAHTLRLRYRLGTPRSDLGGAYPPVLAWTRDGRVRWSFGMADLFPGRHLEAWFPANLPFDQFAFGLELKVVGSPVTHALVTNGERVQRGENTWSVAFPGWFSGQSPMVELRVAEDLECVRGTAAMPASGRTVAVEAWKPRQGRENLYAEVRRLADLLALNEQRFGPLPADRYVCFFHGASGGMEYANATTTSAEALPHEVMHAWFARGITPASHADGWWDEAYTTYRTGGDPPSAPFDFTAPPVRLCSRRPFQRSTPPESYDAGSRFFRGVADLIGQGKLDALMGSLYRARSMRPLSTQALEEYLVARSGAAAVLVDAFHRFVFGYPDPADRPQLRLRALRIEGDQMRAQLENGPATCPHCVVIVAVRPATSRPPRYPHDFLPGAAAVAGFDLRPGESRELVCRLPRIAPGVDRRFEVLASLHARGLHPGPGGGPLVATATW
jgi:hypothetical protein